MAELSLVINDTAQVAEALGAAPVAEPSVGRIVHFWSHEYAQRDPGLPNYGFGGMGVGPYAAIVTQVHKNEAGAVTYVNLAVQPPFNSVIHEGSVAHPSKSFADPARHWTWPERA